MYLIRFLAQGIRQLRLGSCSHTSALGLGHSLILEVLTKIWGLLKMGMLFSAN